MKSKGSRGKTRTRVKRITVVCERSETITSVRNVPERNERGRRADADRVKHRLSVRNVPKPRIELLPFLKPLPEADGRQQGVNKLTPQKGLAEMVETCRDCPEIVRNVRPSKGVTRTMTPRRMLTNAKV